MAHSTHSHNNWRQKERERVRGRRFSFCPSPPSFTPRRTLSLSLIVSIYSQSLTSIKCSVTMTTLAALGRRVAVHSGMSRFFPPLFARSLPVPSAALFFFSRAVVFFTSSSPHTSPPRPAHCVLSFGCQPVLSIRRQSAVRALIWSCQTHHKPSAGLFDIL